MAHAIPGVERTILSNTSGTHMMCSLGICLCERAFTRRLRRAPTTPLLGAKFSFRPNHFTLFPEYRVSEIDDLIAHWSQNVDSDIANQLVAGDRKSVV